MSKTLYRSKVFAKGTSDGGTTDITVVANYSALPAANTVPNEFYWCSAAQGTSWLPGSVGGTYYSAGLYYSNGTTWEYMDTPYQATQSEVDAGTVTNKFVTPATFENASKWSSKLNNSMSTNKLLGRYSASTGVVEEITIGSGLTLTGAGTLNNTATPTPLGYYGAWQDNITQTAAVANTGYPLIYRTVDLENQVRVVTNGTNLTQITFDNTGIYNLQFSVQIQNTGNSQHDVTIWLRKNGTDVIGSAGFISVPARKSAGAGNEGHGVYGWNYLLSIVAGEYYELIWSTSNTADISIQYYSAGSPPPSTASVIVTATQQSGIMAGTGITAINSLTGAAQTLSAGTSGTDFAISSTGTTHTFNLPTASATNRGALSSANWSTFNNKLGSADIGVTVQGYSASTTTLGNTTTGSGSIVLGTSPTFTTSIITPTVTGVTGALTFTNAAQSSGAVKDFTFTSAANTAQTASTEVNAVNFNLSATVQHSTGTISTQRDFYVQARTHSFVGASTISAAGTMVVSAAPIAGTNATLTDKYSIWSQSGNVYFQDANATNFRFGDAGGGNAGISCVWLDQAGSQTSSNFTIGQNGTNSYVNTGTGGTIYFCVGTAETFTMSSTTLAIIDAKNISVGTSTGTKIGTATTQKIGFWNKTPIVQPTTAITGATFVANSGTAVNDASTFGGYTLAKVVAALVNSGILA